jgi:hypothetical protein
VIAWTVANPAGASQRLVLPLVAINLFNWAAWDISTRAFYYMPTGLRGTSDVAALAEWLLDASRLHVLDAIAVAATCVTVFAAWRKNKRLLRAACATIIWLWLTIFCAGLVMASAYFSVMP